LVSKIKTRTLESLKDVVDMEERLNEDICEDNEYNEMVQNLKDNEMFKDLKELNLFLREERKKMEEE